MFGLPKVKEILHENQYPAMFYEPVIHDVLEKIILKKQGLDKKIVRLRCNRQKIVLFAV